MFLFISVAVTSLFIYFLYECFFGRPLRFIRHFEAQGIYGPAFRPVVGSLPEIQAAAAKHEIEKHGIETAQQYGYVHTMMVGFMPLLAIADPEMLRELFTSQAHCYHKSEDSQKDFLRPLQGNGLLLSEDEYWKKQRALVSPAFHFSCLKEMVPMMVDSAAVVMKKWATLLDQRLDEHKERDYAEIGMNKELAAFTLDTVATAAFGSAFHDNPEMQQAFIHTLKDVLDAIQFRVLTFIAMIPIVRMLPCLGRSTIVNGCGRIDEIVHRVVEDRRVGRSSSVGARKDLLDMLLEARDENGHQMPLAAVEEESKNFISAGAETTSNLLTWMVYRMALDSTLWAQCAAEVRRVLGGREPDAESVKDLKLVEAVAYEALRLHPPAPLLPKYAIKEHTLHAPDGRTLHIPAGVNITINANVVHRNPLYWEEPDTFRPTRFLSAVDKLTLLSTSNSGGSGTSSSSGTSSGPSTGGSLGPSATPTSASTSAPSQTTADNSQLTSSADGDVDVDDNDVVVVGHAGLDSAAGPTPVAAHTTGAPASPGSSSSSGSAAALPTSHSNAPSSSSSSPAGSQVPSASTSAPVSFPLSDIQAAAASIADDILISDHLIDPDDTADYHPAPSSSRATSNRPTLAPKPSKKQHPFAFLGFSAGPRKCIGKNFAMLEIKVVIAMILQRYTFEVAPGQNIVPDPITRIPKHDIVMKVRHVVPAFDPNLPPQGDDPNVTVTTSVLKPTGMI